MIVEGSNESKKELERKKINDLTLDEQYEFYENQGFSKKEIIKQIAKNKGVSKNEVYQYFLECE